MSEWLKKNWLKVLLPLLVAALLLWAGGCPPRTPSPLNPDRKLDINELTDEFNNLIDRYETAILSLEEQARIRKLIMTNALMIAEAGTFNPLGVLTAIAGAYGVGSAATGAGRVIKKRRKITSS